jgi:hypothetical protein
MPNLHTRRQFVRAAAASGAVVAGGKLAFLASLPRVSAREASLDNQNLRFTDELEPLICLLEQTPRERVLEEVGARIRHGLGYQPLLAALLLAGVRNIQPRPVGFKFHAVLVVNSAHLASLASPEADRWLPIFWALDYFKSSQAQDEREGDWTMSPASKLTLPPSHKARPAFLEAMDNWDEPAADAAIAALARKAGANELFEIFCRYGARDFRDLGHKAIYVANSWRTLQAIGWQHCEPVLRSLAYALLDRRGEANPAQSDLPADRPWRRNVGLVKTIRADWLHGKPDDDATRQMLDTLRTADADEACDQVVELLNRQVAPRSVWDALFGAAGEMLMRRPGIVSLHAVTTTNALHFAFQQSANDETRRLLLLQNAAFLPLFRGELNTAKELRVDDFSPAEIPKDDPPRLPDIFDEISRDRLSGARKVLAYLNAKQSPEQFIQAARRMIFLKGNNSHDYKFSSAVLEDYAHLSPVWRDRFLAASVFNLRGSGGPDNSLVQRTRAALSG